MIDKKIIDIIENYINLYEHEQDTWGHLEKEKIKWVFKKTRFLLEIIQFSKHGKGKMKHRIWLDDFRPMPEGYTTWVKSAEHAIWLIATESIEFISFDNDLGLGSEMTGYDVAVFIEKMSNDKLQIVPIGWEIHSANPVGRRNIKMAMESAERFWK